MFDDETMVDRAIARLTNQSNTSIKQVLDNAVVRRLEKLAEACREELRLRGSLQLTAEDARSTAEIALSLSGKSLSEVVQLAFSDISPKREESVILKWIWQHPGTSYQETLAHYGRGDLSLVIGHLVFYRFGYFRPLLATQIQSDILLERNSASGQVCYRLRSETVQGLCAIGVL